MRRTKLDPLGELALGAYMIRVDAQPATHRPPAHLHQASVGRRNEQVGLRWVYVNQYSTLAARCHGHVPADKKGEPAEHLLLGQARFAADHFAYAADSATPGLETAAVAPRS